MKMSDSQITSLGEAAAKAAIRVIELGNRCGYEQNRGQFVSMMKYAIENIPTELRGDWANSFLENEARFPYGR